MIRSISSHKHSISKHRSPDHGHQLHTTTDLFRLMIVHIRQLTPMRIRILSVQVPMLYQARSRIIINHCQT